MTNIQKCCSILLLLALLIHLIPPTVSSANFADDISSDAEINPEYLEEMEALGFSENDVVALRDWNLKIINAGSMQEVDALMDEYNDLTKNNAISTTASADSFYTSTGGTLVLDYTGEINPVSQVIYTKIVYLPVEQVLFYHTAMNSESFFDYLWDEFLDEGISIITAKIAVKIAAYLGIPSSGLKWLIGTTLGIIVWILQNLDKWDLDDAINNSTTQKVKLEFYYLQCISYPYYEEFHNYEPWNSSYIDIPENYEYIWYVDIYEYDSSIHLHYLEYLSNGDGTHTASCVSCSEVSVDDCDLEYVSHGSTQHRLECTDCDYISTATSCSFTYTSNSDQTHTGSCSDCGGTSTIACSMKYSYTSSNHHIGECSICGYTTSDLSCNLYCTYTGDGSSTHTHEGTCQVCGYDISETCTFAYMYHSTTDGANYHVSKCTGCNHTKGKAIQCLYDSENNCLVCGVSKYFIATAAVKVDTDTE